MYKIYLKLTIKTPLTIFTKGSIIYDFVLVSLLLTMNRFHHTLFWRFHYWLCARKYQLESSKYMIKWRIKTWIKCFYCSTWNIIPCCTVFVVPNFLCRNQFFVLNFDWDWKKVGLRLKETFLGCFYGLFHVSLHLRPALNEK